MKIAQALAAYGAQVFIAVDQLVNAAVMPLFTWSLGYADETLSARAWRVKQRNKVWGKLFVPVIDLLFFWQGPNHCKNAYEKERNKAGLPADYREERP